MPSAEFEGGEATLADRFRNGDREAFDRIVRDNRRAVYLMARRVLHTHEDADEAAQVAFVRAWKARGGFRGTSSIRTWLLSIVLNVARTLQASIADHRGDEALERLPDGGEGSEARLRRSQSRERVRQAVARLPRRQREAVLLKVFSELTYKETAEVMALSEGAVKAHLHQAVSNLRRLMTSDSGPGEDW